MECQGFDDETRSALLGIAIKSSFENLVFISPVRGGPLVEGSLHGKKTFAKGIQAEKYLTVCKSGRQLPD